MLRGDEPWDLDFIAISIPDNSARCKTVSTVHVGQRPGETLKCVFVDEH